MSTSWPNAVTQSAQIDGWSEAPVRNAIAFKPKQGPDKERRQTASARTLLKYNLVMNSDDYDTLIDWYRDDLLDGVLVYTGTHPRKGSSTPINGKFQSEPSVSAQSGTVLTVTIQTMLLP